MNLAIKILVEGVRRGGGGREVRGEVTNDRSVGGEGEGTMMVFISGFSFSIFTSPLKIKMTDMIKIL